MTQQEWEGLSPEEQQAMMEENAAEMERCKDQRYFYNNYCRKEGEPEYSQEQWDYYMKREEARRIGGRQWAKHMNGMIPLTPSESFEQRVEGIDIARGLKKQAQDGNYYDVL